MSDAPYPIVLAHGICRFDELTDMAFDIDDAADDRFHYFRRIRSTLKAHGYEAHHSHVSWAAGLETRAAELRDELVRITEGFTRAPRVFVIAHSMGGLDARHMMFRFGMYDRVAGLATVGTPHWGTSFADWGIEHLNSALDVVGRWGLDLNGFRDLTRASCRAFNEQAEAAERAGGVRFRTYAGAQTEDRVAFFLRIPWRIIQREEGANDGLVSVQSARWRDEYFVRTIDADHRNEIGWWDEGDAGNERALAAFRERIESFYVEVAADLVGGT
jgi:triacylglycerol lipase